MKRVAIFAAAMVLGTAGIAYGTHLATDTAGHTTLEQILAASSGDFKTLSVDQVDENYIVRAPDALAPPRTGRETRRTSLAYFSQLTDFQLADEESPARVEFLDTGANSAWRPQEAFHPFFIDASIRQINRFATASPVPQGSGGAAAMDFTLVTGDQADNQQRNEMIWTRALLEGGTMLDFGSGVEDVAFYTSPDFVSRPSCPALLIQEGSDAAAAAEATGYTGVQDYDDYPLAAPPGPDPAYYDPDVNVPTSSMWADFPVWTGLMDRAQTLAFTPAGLDVPSYWTNGNHDALVQGNEDATAPLEQIATGCFKALGTTVTPGPGAFGPDPTVLLSPTAAGMLIPPDPLRRFASKLQVKAILGAHNRDNDHGFDFVDASENAASAGSASYYAWDPPQTPGLRFINIDTNSEGGVLGPFGPEPTGSSDGNIDDPQFQWLKQELDAAQAADKLIVIWGHHPVRTLDAAIPDEAAAPCTATDTHGDDPEHDANPGCDSDTRSSEPLHFGDPDQATEFNSSAQTFTELLAGYPNVVAYVAGHTHEHRLIPFTRPDGTAWWEINTSATADWPQQHRLIEVMDNHDGTLSIFGTVLDAAAPAAAPAAGSAAGFSVDQLASIGRTLAVSDPQAGPPTGEGTDEDQNVEMLIRDPRRSTTDKPGSGCVGDIRGNKRANRLKGTPLSDRIRGGAGNDVIRGLGGNDCLNGQRGRDRVIGGAGSDVVRGGGGPDRIKPGRGIDLARGGGGRDRIKARDGVPDGIRCGKGFDTVIADRLDRTRGCERVRRPKRR